jgi:hypothetical protein
MMTVCRCVVGLDDDKDTKNSRWTIPLQDEGWGDVVAARVGNRFVSALYLGAGLRDAPVFSSAASATEGRRARHGGPSRRGAKYAASQRCSDVVPCLKVGGAPRRTGVVGHGVVGWTRWSPKTTRETSVSHSSGSSVHHDARKDLRCRCSYFKCPRADLPPAASS